MLIKIFILSVLILVSLVASADGSFRLSNGKLIKDGISIGKLQSLAGKPLYHDVHTTGVDNGRGGNIPIKRETLTFELKGFIGGLYIVTASLENGVVVSISSRQKDRI